MIEFQMHNLYYIPIKTNKTKQKKLCTLTTSIALYAAIHTMKENMYRLGIYIQASSQQKFLQLWAAAN